MDRRPGAPMAFLLGVLIGVRTATACDSEIMALRSCGVGPIGPTGPALLAAARPVGRVFLLSTTSSCRRQRGLIHGRSPGSRRPRSSTVIRRTFRSPQRECDLFDRAARRTNGRSTGLRQARRGIREGDQRSSSRRRLPDARGRPPLARPLRLGTLHEYEAAIRPIATGPSAARPSGC